MLQKEKIKISVAVQGLAVHLREAGHGQAVHEPAAASPDHLVTRASVADWLVRNSIRKIC